MQGNYAFCKKHGHNWQKKWETIENTGMLVWKCSICGARQVYWL